ncbi:MAG: gephyrin-like molybdotransferase Glp [Chloroflexota bacterium]
MTDSLVSYTQALRLTLEHISPLDSETISLFQSVGRMVARDLAAMVDAPSVDVSLKDGYAIRSEDIDQASVTHPVRLRLMGSIAAGDQFKGELTPGTAIRILSGARIPMGAQAVVSEEFAHDDGHAVVVTNNAEPGRNILRRGGDVCVGQPLVAAGARLRPAQVGLLAASGYDAVPAIRLPNVAIIATGTEVIAPGEKLQEGKLFASNLVTLSAWCTLYGMQTRVSVVEDQAAAIKDRLLQMIAASDAIITSGGAWTGEHDLVIRLLDELGWRKIYHKVKMGPGKAIGFGVWRDKPIFCLPGGPPSNQMAFIQLALPGLLKLAGRSRSEATSSLPRVMAKLAQDVAGQKDWTQFIEGRFQRTESEILFHPYKMASRLQSMGDAEGILAIPEGAANILKGVLVRVQVLPWDAINNNVERMDEKQW